MSNEFWSAIGGAVVGGLIAFGIQLVALRAAAKQRAEEAAERRKALGHALLFKMLKIHSNLHGFNEHLQETFAKAEKAGFGGEPWQIVRPIANHPATVHFSTDEMAMLLSLKNDDVFNDVLSMDGVHNSTIALFQTFAECRHSLTSLLPAEMEGIVGTTEITQEQMQFLRPKMAEVNDLIISMRQRCELDTRDAWSVLTRLQAVLKDKVGLKIEIERKPDRQLRG